MFSFLKKQMYFAFIRDYMETVSVMLISAAVSFNTIYHINCSLFRLMYWKTV